MCTCHETLAEMRELLSEVYLELAVTSENQFLLDRVAEYASGPMNHRLLRTSANHTEVPTDAFEATQETNSGGSV